MNFDLSYLHKNYPITVPLSPAERRFLGEEGIVALYNDQVAENHRFSNPNVKFQFPDPFVKSNC